MVEGVADRLRHLSHARLAEVEHRVRPLVAELAALALQAEGQAPRPLPDPAARAIGDQVEVLGGDLVAALSQHPAQATAARARDLLADLRRALP
jgi:hypothetical protein